MRQRWSVHRASLSAMVVIASGVTLAGCASIEGLFGGSDPPRPYASVLPPPNAQAVGGATTTGGRRPQDWRAGLVEAEACL